MAKLVKKIKHVHGEFVDPSNVGSTVRYTMETSMYDDGETSFDSDLSFGDCTRVVTWSGYGKEGRADQLRKVDKAIQVLSQARDQLVMHGIIQEKYEKEYAKKAGVSKPKKKRARRYKVVRM